MLKMLHLRVRLGNILQVDGKTSFTGTTDLGIPYTFFCTGKISDRLLEVPSGQHVLLEGIQNADVSKPCKVTYLKDSR